MKKSKIISKIEKLWKKGNNAFCQVFLCKTNLKRDVLIISIAIILSVAFIVSDKYYYAKKAEGIVVREVKFLSEEQIYQQVKAIQETIDMENWKTYQSRWYGFEVKYPENWSAPSSQATQKGSNWEYAFRFRKDAIEEGDSYAGFDLIVYNLSRAKELQDTEEFPTIKNADLKIQGECENINGHIIETGDYPAEEIYVPVGDDCYNPALFFSFTRGTYVYNLVPRLKEGIVLTGDPNIEITDHFPEFFSVASALKMIDIVRPPKPQIAKAKIAAPYPVSFKKKNGRLVCAKKNDHPSKSKQNKKKHLDRECCLDPDEYPNPHCYYPPEKYGKYLK